MTDEQEQLLEAFLDGCIQNHIDEDASFDGIMFETSGEELQFVLKMAEEKRVATYCDVDNGTAIVSGYHLVNRIGYFITNAPITTEFALQVSIDSDK